MDRYAGGIANDVLVDAVQKRGWRVRRVDGTLDALQALRVKVPGSAGVLRVDVAHGVRDGADALTFGWLF